MVRMTRMAVAVLALSTLAVACDDGTTSPDGMAPLTLSFTTGAPQQGLAASVATFSVPISDGTHTLDVERAWIEYSSIEVERADGSWDGDSDGDSDSESDSDGNHDEYIELDGGTFELPVESGVITPFTTLLPAGVYDELEVDVTGLRLVGTYDGESFDVTIPVDLDLELEIDPPMELVEGETLNLTVQVNVPVWFRSADGHILDPRDIAVDDDLRYSFRQRLAFAFHAFEDSDRDGDDQDSDSDSH